MTKNTDTTKIVQRAQTVIQELKRTQPSVTKKDIGDWRKAHQIALNVENPQRKILYDIYDFTTDIDTTVTGIVARTRLEIMQKKFRLIDSKGVENVELTNVLEATWFKDFMLHSLEANYYGHSLVELGDVVVGVDGVMGLSGVKLLPRRHVIPEYGVVVRQVGDEPKKGIPYRDNQWVVESGRSDSLGLFLKVTPHVISKKHCQIFWDDFAERFGMPIIFATTASQNPSDIDKLNGAFANSGSNAYAILPAGTTLQMIETSKGDAFQVFDQRIERANKEICIALAGQTMVFEDGSSRSQAEVHERGFEKIIWQFADALKDTINNQLLPRLVMLGFPFAGYRFDWNDSYDYSPKEMLGVEQMLLNAGFEVDAKYFVNKYGIPITGNRGHGVGSEGTQSEGGKRKTESSNLSAEDLFFY